MSDDIQQWLADNDFLLPKLPNLRRWQANAIHAYNKIAGNGGASMLVEATPGAGKTRLGLAIAQNYTLDKHFIVFVVPTKSLCTQWASSAMYHGIDLLVYDDGIPDDYHGIVTTYAKIAQKGAVDVLIGQIVSTYGADVRILLVADEIHHTSTKNTWGSSLLKLAYCADFTLGLTGTPWRSDDVRIPLLKYIAKKGKPDVQYTYSMAVQDGYVAPVAFHVYDGQVTYGNAGAVVTFAQGEEAGQKDTKRLQTILDPNSGWVTDLLSDANTLLRQIRHGNPRSGGIVVAKDKRHADELAQILDDLGESPVVVHSDTSDSSEELEAFVDGDAPWLVVVRMASEGFDCPRLVVAVYLTNVSTEMFFAQFVGRIARRDEPNKMGHCFLPRSVASGHASQFMVLGQGKEIDEEGEGQPEPRRQQNQRRAEQRTWMPELNLMHASALSVETMYPHKISQAPMTPLFPIDRMRQVGMRMPKQVRAKGLRRQIHSMVSAIVATHPHGGKDGTLEYADVYSHLTSIDHATSATATEDMLYERIKALRGMFANTDWYTPPAMGDDGGEMTLEDLNTLLFG